VVTDASNSTPRHPAWPARLPGALRRAGGVFASLPKVGPRALSHLWRTQRHWLFVLIPLLIIMVRPLRWCWGLWFSFDSPLIFQPFVPLLSFALLWERRADLEPIYQELSFYPPDSPKRRGKLWPILLGCALMLIASIAMLPSLAMLSFVVILGGCIYYLYGPHITLALWQPLVLLFLMVPPPGGLVPQFTGKLQIGSASVVAPILRLLYPVTRSVGEWVFVLASKTDDIHSHSLQITPALSGMSVLLPVLVLTFWQALRLRVRPLNIPVLLSIALLLTLHLNAIRLVLLGVIGGSNPEVARELTRFNSWILVAIAFYLTYKISRFFAPRTMKSLGEEA
jgi:hypothetical protein